MIMLPAEDKRRVWGSTGNAKFHEAEVEGSRRLWQLLKLIRWPLGWALVPWFWSLSKWNQIFLILCLMSYWIFVFLFLVPAKECPWMCGTKWPYHPSWSFLLRFFFCVCAIQLCVSLCTRSMCRRRTIYIYIT